MRSGWSISFFTRWFQGKSAMCGSKDEERGREMVKEERLWHGDSSETLVRITEQVFGGVRFELQLKRWRKRRVKICWSSQLTESNRSRSNLLFWREICWQHSSLQSRRMKTNHCLSMKWIFHFYIHHKPVETCIFFWNFWLLIKDCMLSNLSTVWDITHMWHDFSLCCIGETRILLQELQ